MANIDTWDVFISHAHEDKAEIAKPLAEALRAKGLRVWYDDFSLQLGDSLRQSIDRGLAHSRYGAVILSPRFFEKHWPKQELNGLAMREVNGEKVILPIWHNINHDAVRDFSPTLADRVAIPTEKGLEAVVEKILAVVTQQGASPNGELQELAQLRIELERSYRDLERSYDVTLEALADALDLRNSELEGHCKRVTAFTIALARASGRSSEEVRVIARGAFLHDIGNMGVPGNILRKPAKLTEEEMEWVKKHPDLGYQMLKKIPFLSEAAEIVYTHQECFDGNGYPRGLKGEQIPLGARIVAVADALDAMRSERPYRRALSFQDARDEIVRWSGRQFDPKVVGTFLRIPETMWEDLRREIDAAAPSSLTSHPLESRTKTNDVAGDRHSGAQGSVVRRAARRYGAPDCKLIVFGPVAGSRVVGPRGWLRRLRSRPGRLASRPRTRLRWSLRFCRRPVPLPACGLQGRLSPQSSR